MSTTYVTSGAERLAKLAVDGAATKQADIEKKMQDLADELATATDPTSPTNVLKVQTLTTQYSACVSYTASMQKWIKDTCDSVLAKLN